MSDAPQHAALDGTADYIAALDVLCGLAQRELIFFEKNFAGAGFNSTARYDVLRAFLLANRENRLCMLAHDTRHITRDCPRLALLARQFGHAMHVRKTPQRLRHLTDPFAVSDETAYVRRFHFDDPRGVFAREDAEGARMLKSRFAEIWADARPSAAITTLFI